ncbi:unnamed protein product [Bursaphelenchus okinawaensis]|uniref:G-protein coupled receptors family 1 profile domain-containing protein n=1 Tax=Bursaphelenchus okinawaensis TaxID=465554 RepID=A0A811K956_9BILA|nr:unnamed protein product [Bursaphelenchus okinawaensis]CAG9095488.1 unnamed protein product [Bursaphelenchus okinawaensis]
MDEDLQFLEESYLFNVCSIRPHVAVATETPEQEALDLVWYSNVLVLPSIALVGILCNLLNLHILTSNKAARRMPSWHLLVSLALFDSLFLVFATLDVTPSSLHLFIRNSTLNAMYTKMVLYIRTIASTFFRASILVVVAFNIERYVCVCKPLWAHRVCTSRTSLLAVMLSLTIAFGCSLQWPLVYQVTECFDYESDHYYYIITMKTDATLQMYYRLTNMVSLVMFNIFPILLILVLNSLLVRTLKQVVESDKRRSSGADTTTMLQPAEESNGNKFNANAILFAVVVLLFVCIGPQAPARLLYDYLGPYHPTVVIYMCISQLLVFLNASLNFCIYCLVSRRYRSLLTESIKRLLHHDAEWCSLTGTQLKTKISVLMGPSGLHTEEYPMLERRAS